MAKKSFFLAFKKISRAVRRIFSKKRSPKTPQKRLPRQNDLRLQQEIPLELAPKPIVENTLPAIFEWKGPKGLQAIGEFSATQLSPHTQRAYQNDLKDFFIFLKQRGFESLNAFSKVTPIQVAQYRGYLINEKHLGRSSVTRKLAVLKSFYKYAMAQAWTEKNPAELVRAFPQSQESKTGFLSDDDISVLLNFLEQAPQSERLDAQLGRVVVETLLLLGLRRSEASKICLGHIEYSENTYLLRVQGKGERERLLPLPPRLLMIWEQWLKRILSEEGTPTGSLLNHPQEWLQFFSRCKEQPLLISSRAHQFTKPLSTSEIAHIVRKNSRKAGLIQRVSPHMLRATAITHALDQGASHRGVQQMAGWSSPLMITRYDKRRKDPRFSAVYQLKYAEWPQAKVNSPEARVATPNEADIT